MLPTEDHFISEPNHQHCFLQCPMRCPEIAALCGVAVGQGCALSGSLGRLLYHLQQLSRNAGADECSIPGVREQDSATLLMDGASGHVQPSSSSWQSIHSLIFKFFSVLPPAFWCYSSASITACNVGVPGTCRCCHMWAGSCFLETFSLHHFPPESCWVTLTSVNNLRPAHQPLALHQQLGNHCPEVMLEWRCPGHWMTSWPLGFAPQQCLHAIAPQSCFSLLPGSCWGGCLLPVCPGCSALPSCGNWDLMGDWGGYEEVLCLGLVTIWGDQLVTPTCQPSLSSWVPAFDKITRSCLIC